MSHEIRSVVHFPDFDVPPMFEYIFMEALEILKIAEWSLTFLSEHILLFLTLKSPAEKTQYFVSR